MRRVFAILWLLLISAALAAPGNAASTSLTQAGGSTGAFTLTGSVTDATSHPEKLLAGATVVVGGITTVSDSSGRFRFVLPAGDYKLAVSAKGYAPLSVPLSLSADTEFKVELAAAGVTTVAAGLDHPTADSATTFYATEELLVNSAQPGTPVLIPGLPVETASGGVKAPQYFAPGVAGDHGEPIAQYIQIGDFRLPNNLSANAHGNGYADPNLLIAPFIGNVETDAGAFDVHHGNHAENLAVAYGFRPRVEPFAELTGDTRDFDFISGWSPRTAQTGAFLGLEISGGNGFLRLPEHRRQYKLNGERAFSFGGHQLTLFGAGYYGRSRIPGLVPIDAWPPEDTIDPRQSDRTHTSLFAASDTWQLSESTQFQFSGFFRTYALSLVSNFGDSLIRQSEFRTVEGGNMSFQRRFHRKISLESGIDVRRDAPRNLELARLNEQGVFSAATKNDFTITDLGPYASVRGAFSRFLSYSVGARRDEIRFDNIDKMMASNSYRIGSGVTSPRGTIAFHLPQKHIPLLAFSYGEAFHTNDPRIGIGTVRGTPIATARAYQLNAVQSLKGTEMRVALSRVASSSELAKLDPDTGLQENVGPSLVRSLTASIRRRFSFGSLQATFARATAMNPLTRQDVPEAPRLIWDVSGTSFRLPGKLQASGELEYVGRKPLGDGFTAVPVREVRGSVTRAFADGRFDAGIHFLGASGYAGQTLETLQIPGELTPSERMVGVRKTSYVGVTLRYYFRRESR
jgi:hypothetical protein